MNPFPTISQESPLSWKQATQNHAFRLRLILGHLLLISLVLALPHFFDYIEDREGFMLYDPILNILSPLDLSVPIFISIWGTTALLLYRCVNSPAIYITAIYGFAIILLARIITITLVPLDAPSGLIPLIDPISNIAYGKVDYITKDLFFSGHTSSQFLIFLCLTNKRDKMIALTSTFLVGCMVLFQHVYYTIDVLAAPVFTYACVWLGKELSLKRWYTATLSIPKKEFRV